MEHRKNENPFRTEIGRHIFTNKYALTPNQTWYEKARSVVEDVCGKGYYGQYPHPLMAEDEREELIRAIAKMQFLPGGRYLYYAGRPANFYNNCYLNRAEEDTREEWARLTHRVVSELMTGGGVGVDYSIIRPSGRILSKTGGQSSGPVPLMKMINEQGRNVMQGGSRRSAIYGSLNWQHEDIPEFLEVKDWDNMPLLNGMATVGDAKKADFNYPAPLDMTNISVNYDDEWLNKEDRHLDPVFLDNCRMALKNGEPGFSFNFGDKQNETLRNACTEVTSEDDSDVCNLGSVNMAAIENIEEFRRVVHLASKFLVCGTIRADLPHEKVHEVREKNRRIGLGLMGMHEWLLQRGERYEVTPEMHQWLRVYQEESERAANEHCDRLFLNRPVAYRSIAPTGSIGMLAGTTTGIEPLFAVAYKRRYITGGDQWKYEYVVDVSADQIIQSTGADPDEIETSNSMAADPERRIRFQAEVQRYVDMGISSTINLPAWGTEYNNEDTLYDFAYTLSQYAPFLRGFTCFPDGARGGQPLEPVDYATAKEHQGTVFEEHQEQQCQSGVCGV